MINVGHRNLDGNSDITLRGDNWERVNTFKYLGATLAENGYLDAKMTHIIQPGRKNWKRESWVLCDRRISLRVKGKMYKTIVKSTMVYAAETWAVKKTQYVAEMDEWSYQAGQNKE